MASHDERMKEPGSGRRQSRPGVQMGPLPGLPPLDALYFFEVAARLGSFAAARELSVTPGAVSHRIKCLEDYLGVRLFECFPQGVRLNRLGRTYLEDVQRIFAELRDVTGKRRGGGAFLKLVAVEVVAEKWLMPRLAEFRAAHPDIAIEFETDHRELDPVRHDFDVWVAFTNKVGGRLHAETLFEETLLPVCSPALVEERGQPGKGGRSARLAAALRSALDVLLGPLVRASRRAAARPVAGFGFPPLQHDGAGRGRRHGCRARSFVDDRTGVGGGAVGDAVRHACSGARPLSAGHDARLETQARGAGVQEVDPGPEAG